MVVLRQKRKLASSYGMVIASLRYESTWNMVPDRAFSGRPPPTAVGGGRPENALSGTMFQVDSYRSDAITIPYDDANLRFWRNTTIANLQPGQTATLPQNYLGYEWDESPD